MPKKGARVSLTLAPGERLDVGEIITNEHGDKYAVIAIDNVRALKNGSTLVSCRASKNGYNRQVKGGYR